MSLLQNIKDGDELAFRQFYEVYKEKLFNYFLKRTNFSCDAEDLLQNTFLRVWRYRASLNANYLPDQQLFHIARTVFIDYTRRQNKVENIRRASEKMDISQQPLQEAMMENRQLQSVLLKMPELRRKAFVLNKIEGYSYREIADVLSVNVKSVDNNISRALKQIRKAMLSFAIFFFFS